MWATDARLGFRSGYGFAGLLFRGANSSQVLEPSITPRTNRQLPTASGGNMNLQTLHWTAGVGASL